jgi:hypothetical protein
MFIRGVLKKFPEFFSIEGLVHLKFVPPAQCYWSLIRASFAEVARRIFGGSGATSSRYGQWFLHHVNAPSHTSLVVQQFLAEKSFPVISQTPYSPDLTLSDFCLFPTLKMGLKGTRFATMETSNRMVRWNSGKFQQMTSEIAANSCKIDVASVCVRKGSFFEGD